MQIHNLVQGSAEWHAYRANHFNASDAPAMMGVSPYKTRSQLLHELATGSDKEVDAATQRLFDDGHRFEALARPLAEEIIGQDLYPVVGSDGVYSASFDGLTMAEDIAFEHKSLNDDLRNCIPAGDIGELAVSLPIHYAVQMEQQCMVSGAERILFMASQWKGDTLIEERHCWYYPNPELRAQIIAGWEQFDKDLAAYVPPEAKAEAVGRTPETLPALRIEVTGMVTASNLEAFKEHSLAVFGAIKRDLQTDQDFADAEKTVKWCGDVEERLSAAKQHALSQTATIDELFRTIDGISAEARRVRLDLDRLVKARKESLREEIRQATVTALRAHYIEINASLGMGVMLGMPAAFGAEVANAMKGKKTLSSLRDAADTTLAGAKIDANTTAERVRKNIAILESHKSHAFLLADGAQLAIGKEPETLELIVKSRITDHQAAEAKRIEAERASIAEEERIKAEAAAERAAAARRAELERQQQEVARQQAELDAAHRRRQDEEAAAKAAEEAEHKRMVEIELAEETELAGAAHAAGIAQDVAPRALEALAEQSINSAGQYYSTTTFKENGDPIMLNKDGSRSIFCDVDEGDDAPATPTPPTMRLGQIGERLGFSVSAELLRELGIEPADHSGRAVLFHEHQFPGICTALISRIDSARRAHRMAEAA